MQTRLKKVETALAALKKGKILVVTDSEDRENEGDLIVAAEFADSEAINFMVTHGRGLVCLAMTEKDINRLKLPMMTNDNRSKHNTPFTISIEAKQGITTGISAFDRATTIKTAIDTTKTDADIISPGHIFPLKANSEGVLSRAGHTEAGVDLMKLAGLNPTAVICEVMAQDGHMAKADELKQFIKQHALIHITIEDIIFYRQYHEDLCEHIATAQLPTDQFDDFTIHAFRDNITQQEHIALVASDLNKTNEPYVRVHSSCVTGDIFSSSRCDCRSQLHFSLQKIQQYSGAVIYMQQEGRGIGLANKIKAYALQQEQGLDTVQANQKLGFSADLRSFHIAAQILKKLGITKMHLLTNNPQKIQELNDFGLEVLSRIPVEAEHTQHNKEYLKTKKDKLGHLL